MGRFGQNGVMAKCTGKAPIQGDKMVDAERQAAKHPRTFLIPPALHRRGLRVGDEAKVIYRGKSGGIRNWATIEHVDTRGCYVGRTSEGVVKFGPRHVIDVAPRVGAKTNIAYVVSGLIVASVLGWLVVAGSR